MAAHFVKQGEKEREAWERENPYTHTPHTTCTHAHNMISMFDSY
jgi:hypothetical protein